MTATQSDRMKDAIATYLTPILIAVIGWLVIQSYSNITVELKKLDEYNVERDQWVLEWVEENQSALDWAKRQMNKE